MNLQKIVIACLVFSFLMIMLPLYPVIAGNTDIRYGGQYYPGEFLLQGSPEFWNLSGIKVRHILFSSGTENNQALISGKIDINCGSDSKTVGLFNVLGEKAVLIATIQKGDRYATIVKADSPYKTWHDLKGKTVATRLGSGAEQVLRRFFQGYDDLAWEDFQWVNLKVENMIAVLQGGSIEAFTVWEPTPAIAESQGIGRVLRTYGDISQVPVSLHTTKKFAENNGDSIVRFLVSHLAKAEMIKNDPEKAAELAAKAASAKGYNVPADAFKRVFSRINFELDVDTSVLESIENTAIFLHEQKKIKKVPRIIHDGGFLVKAKELYEQEKRK